VSSSSEIGFLDYFDFVRAKTWADIFSSQVAELSQLGSISILLQRQSRFDVPLSLLSNVALKAGGPDWGYFHYDRVESWEEYINLAALGEASIQVSVTTSVLRQLIFLVFLLQGINHGLLA
jgi:hypothetical protein